MLTPEPAPDLIPLLARAVAEAAEAPEPGRVFRTFLEALASGGLLAAAIHLPRDDGEGLVLAEAFGLPPPAMERLEAALSSLGDALQASSPQETCERVFHVGEEPLVGVVPQAGSLLMVPLRATGRVQGVVSLWSAGHLALSLGTARLLRTACDALGVLWASGRARERAAREVRRLESVDAAALEIAGPVELHPVLQRIVDQACRITQGNFASLGILADGDPRGPFTAMVQSGSAEQPDDRCLPEAVLARLSQGIAAVRVSDPPPGDCSPEGGWRSLVAVGIRYLDQTLGYLCVARREGEGAFDEEDQRALELLGQHAAIAVAHAREHEQLLRAMEERARSEAALQESEGRFRRLAENVPDVIFRVELLPSPRFEYVNPAIQTVLGHPPDAYLADVELPLRQILPRDRPRLGAALEHPERAGHGLLLRFTHANGRRVWLEARFTPVRSPDGALRGVEGVARDVSAQRRAEEENRALMERIRARRAWLETVIDQSPVGIVLVEDPRGDRLRANREAQQLFGFRLDPGAGLAQLVGHVCDPAGRPVPHDALVSIRALRGELAQMEQLLCNRDDGRSVPVLVSGTPITGARGQIEGAVLIYRDISALKELDRLREEWTSVIAHDLRQPVNVIALQAHLLERGTNDRRLRQRVDHILGSNRKLSRMIDDLLEFSKMESKHLELRRQRVALGPLLRDILGRLERLARGRKVRLELLDKGVRVWADPDRLDQVIGNLVGNALKYGRAGSDVEVRVAVQDGCAQVTVTNEGEGIPPEELPHLFGKFHRTPAARAGQVSGLGLGLYITRGLVEAHGGRIWAESQPQKTCFHFTLPLSRGAGR